MRKKIKIAFVDFWDDFNRNKNFLTDILQKRYDLEIINDSDRSNEVEYLFFSCMGHEHLHYECVRIFFTGENFVPDFNLCDYAIGFEHMQYGDRYFRYPLYMAYYPLDYKRMIEKNNLDTGIEKKFCSFVVSHNAIANPVREEFFHKLSEYKKVDSGGRFLNNIGLENGVEDKFEFQKQYKFGIAFENTSHPGYCTEKLMQAFAAGTVPIYWGDPKASEYFNSRAFINCMEYETLDEAVQRVIELDNDEDLYRKVRLESAIVDEEQTLERYRERFEQWLWNVFEQEIEVAKRVNPYGKQLLYWRELQFTDKVMKKFAPVERVEIKTIKDKIKRKLRLLRR